jgi:hypothetical protein
MSQLDVDSEDLSRPALISSLERGPLSLVSTVEELTEWYV